MPYADKEQQREYQRNWIAQRRTAFFADKSCVKCGSRDRLEIDHIDSNQKVDHRIWSWSDERRNAELTKCQVLCFAHHREKTWEIDRERAEHGTGARYQNYSCRCEECRAWKRQSDAKYRK